MNTNDKELERLRRENDERERKFREELERKKREADEDDCA